MIKLPFSMFSFNFLKKRGKNFRGLAEFIEPYFPFLRVHLIQSKLRISPIDYMSMVLCSIILQMSGLFISMSVIFIVGGKASAIPFIFMAIFVFTIFIFFQNLAYPKYIARKRERDIETHLLTTLRVFTIQINSGASLFNVMVNISSEKYGIISEEFKEMVDEINAGKPEVEVLERFASENPSIFFRRALWQIVNGLNAGSDISKVLNEIIYTLSEEQMDQINNYGTQLNPLAMFYMMVVVIVPALGLSFLIIMASLLGLGETLVKAIFAGLYVFVVFFQVMFMGIVKAKRPNLIRDI